MNDIYVLHYFGVAWLLYFDAYSELLSALFDFHFGGIGSHSEWFKGYFRELELEKDNFAWGETEAIGFLTIIALCPSYSQVNI